MVVIVVVSILASITIPVSKYVIARAKAARQEVVMANIRSALDDYRATYGEYPITPDTNNPLPNRSETRKHYWDNVIPEPPDLPGSTFSNSVFINVNLSTNTIEQIYTYSGGIKYDSPVDFCLTFPLMIRPEREGKRPFMSFEKRTVISQVSGTYDPSKDRGSYEGKRRLKGGEFGKAQVYFGRANPVNRVKAIDPVSGNQWKYECYNGVSYTITTNNF